MKGCLHDLIEIYKTSNFCYSYTDEVTISWCKICGQVLMHIDHDKEKELLNTFIPERALNEIT